MSTKELDINIKRRLYYGSDCGLENCPECNQTLIEEKVSFLLYAKAKNDEAEFVTNVGGTVFCEKCPVVVFDEKELIKAAKAGLRDPNVISFGVKGLINLEAVPKNKRNLELGTDHNPIPIVPFLEDLKKAQSPKINRNDTCICGSGLKYKKCCLNK